MSLAFTCKLYLISKESIHFLSVFTYLPFIPFRLIIFVNHEEFEAFNTTCLASVDISPDVFPFYFIGFIL